MKPRTSKIYVALLHEGIDCWRPVRAEHVGGDLYKIVEAIPEGERWQFQPGDNVLCLDYEFQDGTGLLAVEVSE